MPWARIDLTWIRSRDPYHKLLMWVAAGIAGTDGWDGLALGRFRLTRRDAEAATGLGSRAAWSLVERMISEGLAVVVAPGLYQAAGMLAETRASESAPEMHQKRTKQVAANGDVASKTHQKRTKNAPASIDQDRQLTAKPQTLKEVCLTASFDFWPHYCEVMRLWKRTSNPRPKLAAAAFCNIAKDQTGADGLLGCIRKFVGETDYHPRLDIWLEQEAWRAYLD